MENIHLGLDQVAIVVGTDVRNIWEGNAFIAGEGWPVIANPTKASELTGNCLFSPCVVSEAVGRARRLSEPSWPLLVLGRYATVSDDMLSHT